MGKNSVYTATAIGALTMLNDYRYPTGTKKRSHILHMIRTVLNNLFSGIPKLIDMGNEKTAYRLIDFDTRGRKREVVCQIMGTL